MRRKNIEIFWKNETKNNSIFKRVTQLIPFCIKRKIRND
uniref:Uncharacterized protein n=1 Tax=Podoviridae sp. ctOAf25 TaxID=2825245 RepID=A0A8S5PNI1_9CAUD|nr:MAG TPA: hypothetical protein [Podoviridae sp. ctOAf25]DAS32614.1 MAG TPA: hypothetical protein [Caudoviricetes sp.]DAW61485.1 MAG TPA: hypothetical protein [Caudoviricetes sp.]